MSWFWSIPPCVSHARPGPRETEVKTQIGTGTMNGVNCLITLRLTHDYKLNMYMVPLKQLPAREIKGEALHCSQESMMSKQSFLGSGYGIPLCWEGFIVIIIFFFCRQLCASHQWPLVCNLGLASPRFGYKVCQWGLWCKACTDIGAFAVSSEGSCKEPPFGATLEPPMHKLLSWNTDSIYESLCMHEHRILKQSLN